MQSTPVFKRTRIAPTPSGFLHLGNVFSFVLTAVLARRADAGILLRIDDLDRERADPAYLSDIFESLNFLELPWTEGPKDLQNYAEKYTQVQRLPLYNEALEKLSRSGMVYACTCSRAEILRDNPQGIYQGTCRNKHIPMDIENSCWRLHTERAKQIRVKALGKGTLTTELPAEIHDVIVRRKDQLPAYQLASVIDDLHFGIDLVVRGQDLWPSTLVQLYLTELLQLYAFQDITFLHHPLFSDAGGQKLSKSAGATSVHYLRNNGFTAADIYGLIARQCGIKEPLKRWEDFMKYVDDAGNMIP